MNETPEPIEVTNKLTTVPNSSRASDLFARIVQAVREQQREDEANRSKEQPQQSA